MTATQTAAFTAGLLAGMVVAVFAVIAGEVRRAFVEGIEAYLPDAPVSFEQHADEALAVVQERVPLRLMRGGR